MCEIGTVYVRLTVQAFTVVLTEHREGGLFRSKDKQKSVTCQLLDFKLELSGEPN